MCPQFEDKQVGYEKSKAQNSEYANKVKSLILRNLSKCEIIQKQEALKKIINKLKK